MEFACPSLPPARRRPSVAAVLAVAAALAGACDEAAPAASEGSRGDFVIEGAFEPPGPKLGDNVLSVEVTDLEGEPVTGAVVTVTPFMPAHGHGSPETPAVVDVGGGRYRADNVVLHMPGTWQLTLRAVVGARAGERVVGFELGE
ncbi:FixH family protein [Myxococcota bacterium]|nr:FixH family protein [Myxococcota bacterium]